MIKKVENNPNSKPSFLDKQALIDKINTGYTVNRVDKFQTKKTPNVNNKCTIYLIVPFICAF